MRLSPALALVALLALNGAAAADDDPARELEPVVLTGTQLGAGEQGNVGERYGLSFEHPLVATVSARHS